jgi:hypothetical protein
MSIIYIKSLLFVSGYTIRTAPQQAGPQMKIVLLLSFCLLCACSDVNGQHRSNAQNAALKTCNKYLKLRIDAEPVDILGDAVTFSVGGDALTLRWRFVDDDKTKVGICTTSLDGETFQSAEAVPTKS